jgi:outer membrane protein insertion porin family
MRQENKSFFIIVKFLTLIALGLLFGSCRGTRHLPEGQYLYTGANVSIESPVRIPNRSQLESELEDLVRPNPNPTIFGMRPMVWLHNITQDTADNGWLKRWIHNNLGEAPVLLDRTNPSASANLIQNSLYNNGYFEADVDYEIVQRRRTGEINYTAHVISPYRIDSIIFPQPTNALRSAIVGMQEGSILRPNDTYNVDRLVEERQRISRGVRDKGFYYFAPEHMIFRVDSTLGERRVRIFLNVKDDLPEEVVTQFSMGTITINPNYTFMLDTIDLRADTVSINNYRYILNNRDIRPNVIINSMFMMPDSLYSRTGHEQSVSRLMRMGIFQYANIRFERAGRNTLNAIVHLTPMKKRSIRTELQWVASSFYTGPNFSVAHQNRNFLRGAELFELRLSSGIEFGTGGEQSNFTSYNFGVESSIFFPRYVVPFFDIRNRSSYYVPQTRLRVAYQRINRVQLFTVNSFNVTVGYLWNETRRVRHDLNVIDINFFQLVDTTARFHELYEKYPFIQRNYQEQFILGTNYSYTVNTQLGEWRRHNFYFNVFADVSGNLMHLFQSAIRDFDATPENPYTIFNRAYSQFSRLSTDFRYYYAVDRKNTIASRLFIGVGVPYGNSTSVPFIKQFFSGGTNSIRAFAARSVGPGLVTPEETIIGFYDQLGDMKIEGNLEYRFPIYGFLKGGLFLEAGNIWMISEDAEPESRFNFDAFLNQLAVGTGLGLRIDVDFFLLRFDFGVPLRVPQGWVWNPLPPAVDRNWNNITFNIGIGYSF